MKILQLRMLNGMPREDRKTVRREVGRLSWRERWQHGTVTWWSPGMQRPEQTTFVQGCLQGRRRNLFAWTFKYGFIPLSSERNGSLINTSAISRCLRKLCAKWSRAGASGASLGCMGTESRHRACPQESTRLSRQEFDPLSSPVPITAGLC